MKSLQAAQGVAERALASTVALNTLDAIMGSLLDMVAVFLFVLDIL